MTDDSNDWNNLKQNVSQNKSLEKAKQKILRNREKTERFIPHQPKYRTIKSNPLLEREISLDDQSCVESRIIKTIKRGSIDIDGMIDLHGYTLDEAYNVLYNSLAHAISLNLKKVLVITGKGPYDRNSIRKQLINWLNKPEISSNIIYVSQASSKHGGKGAFYILLRKNQ